MAAPDDRERLIRTLLRPDAYPWRPREVELIETHISWLFLAGDLVVKIKRPVRFDFVDHSTLALRRRSCEAEVRLNRRLTDGIYLDCVPVIQDGDHLVVGAQGEPFEWATLMRRLPAERMLDRLLAAGDAPADLAALLARRLAPFHRDLAERCGDAGDGSDIVLRNLDELRGLTAGAQVELVDGAMRRFVAGQGALLRHRVAESWFKDGHGDLRAEHICLEPGGAVQIFDCVEFNPEIRCADVASDLAFLLMDLDRLGAGHVAAELEARYREQGVDLPVSLVRFYRAHRALVRAKVDLLTGRGGLQTHAGLAAEAGRYLDLATAAMLATRPCLIAMTGLSGCGKSTVAASLAVATGAALVSSDATRKRLAGIAALARSGDPLYSREWTERTYRELMAIAAAELSHGRAVILDATFLEGRLREFAAGVAAEAAVPLLLVETDCRDEVARARIARRAAAGRSVSDADLSVYERQRQRYDLDAIPVPPGAIRVRIDTSAEDARRLDPFYEALRRIGLIAPRD